MCLPGSVFRANKQIFKEATSSINARSFLFKNVVALYTFLVTIGASNRELLTAFSLKE